MYVSIKFTYNNDILIVNICTSGTCIHTYSFYNLFSLEIDNLPLNEGKYYFIIITELPYLSAHRSKMIKVNVRLYTFCINILY